jgi:membrane protease YdiL (CAAX protease family)
VAQWALFTAVAGVLTVLLLVLARQSQQLLEAQSTPADPETQAGDDRAAPATEPGSEQFDEQPERAPGNQTDTESDSENRVGTEDPFGNQTETAHSFSEDDSGEQPAVVDSESGRESDEQGVYGDPTQGPDIELTSTALFANVAVTQGLVIVVLVVAAWYFRIPASGFGVTGDMASTGVQAIALGVGFGVALWVGNELSTTVADAVGASYDEGVRELMAPESTGGWLILFVFVLPVIAIAEELLFRGALIGVPAAGFGVSPWLLAVVASLAFALGHGAQGRVGIVVTGVLGFVLAAGYIVSGSLLLVIVAHYLINGLEFFVHEYLGVEALFGGFAGSW